MRVNLSGLLSGLGCSYIDDGTGNYIPDPTDPSCGAGSTPAPAPVISAPTIYNPTDAAGNSCIYGVNNGICNPAPLAPLSTPTPVISSSGGGTLANTTGGTMSSAQVAAALGPLATIAGTRYAVPQLNPGQSITVLPNGGYQVTQQPAGVAASGASLTTSSLLSGSTPLLLIGAVVVVMMMQKGGR